MIKRKKLIYGISAKADGPMKYSGGLTDKQVLDNRKKFFSKSKIDLYKVVWAEAVHGNNIKIVGKRQAGRTVKDVDGLITDEKGIYLAITVADCLPVYFYDPKRKVIAIVHAGWRGLLKNIGGWTIKKIVEEYKASPRDLKVFIGPHIRKCHFTVKTEVARKFFKYRKFVLKKSDKYYIDLLGILKEQLMETGVKKSNIKISQECTYCLYEKFFSFRRDKPKELMTMVAYIGRK